MGRRQAGSVIVLVLAWMLAASDAARAQPIDACGTIVRYATCRVFELPSGAKWAIPQNSSLQPGESGRLVGILDTTCIVSCPVALGCVQITSFGPCQPLCRADFDGSGSTSIQDLFTYLQAFFTGTLGASPPGGDFGQSGQITIQDLFDFLAAWFRGCP